MLFKAPKLSAEELEVIDKIASAYKSAKNQIVSPRRWTGVLHRSLMARAIQGSNSIEGYLVSKEDAINAVDGEQPFEAEAETWLEIMGYRDAMTYVLQLSRDTDFTFNEGFLRSLHFMMLKHDLSKNPGNWRPGAIYVQDEATKERVYEGPPSESVLPLTGELIRYLQSSEDSNHLTVKGALAHLNLVMIHPFSDGNGRMARCLQTLVLASRGVIQPDFCSIEEYLGRNRQEYYDALAEVGKGSWNPQNDTRQWIRFNLTAHYRQAITVLVRIEIIKQLWDELEVRIKSASLPARAINALSDAAMGFAVRSSHYQQAADVSNVVASRDLSSLVKAGFLVNSGERRWRKYVASDDLKNIYLGIRKKEFRIITDPFKTS